MPKDSVRGRKHPLGLKLLSENYKELLQQFKEFQGAHRDSSSSCSDVENESGLQAAAEQQNTAPCPNTPADIAVVSAVGLVQQGRALKTPPSCARRAQQHTTAGTIVHDAAATPSIRKPDALLPGCKTPPTKPRTTPEPAAAVSCAPAEPQPQRKRQAQLQRKLTPKREAGAGTGPSGRRQAILQPAVGLTDREQQSPEHQAVGQNQQSTHEGCQQLAQPPAAVHGVSRGSDGLQQAAVAPVSGNSAVPMSKPQYEPAAVKGVRSAKSVQRKQQGGAQGTPAAAGSPATTVSASAASTGAADSVESADRQQQASEGVSPAPGCVQPVAAAGKTPTQEQKQQQQQRTGNPNGVSLQNKLSRRRVGTHSKPLTAVCNSGTDSSTTAAASPAAGAAVAATPSAPARTAATAAATPGAAVSKRAASELPRLALQLVQSVPTQLPPLHPLSARTAQQAATKASKSEPASARISRRTSDSSTDGSAGCHARASDSSVDGSTGPSVLQAPHQRSLPEPGPLPSNRRHSIACLVEVSRRQLQRAQTSSEGGLGAGRSGGTGVHRPPQQPLQPLKQLQDIRRRGQLKAGGPDASQDCQVLKLDGNADARSASNTRLGSSNGSSYSSSQQQHTARPACPGTSAAPAAGPDRHWQGLSDAAAAPAAAHRRTHSSNTQLPPLDEHAVLEEPGLHTALTGPAGAAAALVPCADARAPTPPMDNSCAVQPPVAEGSCGSLLLSRRSSRADSEASSAADGSCGGLVCEPSSFGVCADPAGAVHLVAAAIPDKLARLKQRLPSRLTADTVAAAVAAAPGSAVDSSTAPAPAAAVSKARLLEGQDVPAAAEQPPAAVKPERIRARWQLPAVPAQHPQQQPTCPIQPQQQPLCPIQPQQQPLCPIQPQQLQPGPHQQEQQWQQHAPVTVGWHRGGTQAQGPGWPPPQGEAHTRDRAPGAPPPQQQHQQHQGVMDNATGQSAAFTGQQLLPAATGPAVNPSVTQQPPPHPQQQQQQQQGVNHTFMSELRRQLEHWASWVHMHSSNPQQVPPPPQLPPELQAAVLMQQQQPGGVGPLPALHQQLGLHAPAGPSAASAGPLPPAHPGGFIGPVPAHGALSRFTDPWAEKQQQRLQQQQQQQQQYQYHQQWQGAPASSAAQQPAACLQQQGCSVVQEQQQVPASPPLVSAAALAQQRRAMQQQAFEGLSLEAVLASAKKAKPTSKRQLLEAAGGGGDGEH